VFYSLLLTPSTLLRALRQLTEMLDESKVHNFSFLREQFLIIFIIIVPFHLVTFFNLTINFLIVEFSTKDLKFKVTARPIYSSQIRRSTTTTQSLITCSLQRAHFWYQSLAQTRSHRITRSLIIQLCTPLLV
jgi:hypothetical protein